LRRTLQLQEFKSAFCHRGPQSFLQRTSEAHFGPLWFSVGFMLNAFLNVQVSDTTKDQ
jgi:hypothetical protein